MTMLLESFVLFVQHSSILSPSWPFIALAFFSQGVGGSRLDEFFFVKVSAGAAAVASFGAAKDSRDDEVSRGLD